MMLLPLTPTKASQGRGVCLTRNTGNTRSSLTQTKSGKVRLLGPLRYTIRFMSHVDIVTNELRTIPLGCVRFRVWELLFGDHVDRAHKHVEHAIRVEAEGI